VADLIDDETCALLVEPVQGEGGVRIPPPEFLPALRRRCDETGTLLVLDEVVTGFGRTGRLFAHEHWGIVPDVLVLAKALGGGLPLGAFVGSPAVMATLSRDPPLAHVTTFGGHPVSCAAGLAALEVLLREDLPRRAAALGARLLASLRPLVGRGGLREVRGIGLHLGLEFGTAADCARFAERALARRLILNWTLHRDTVIRLAPPLVLSDAEADEAMRRITASLA
jgi:acetylornithine/succinyldiaminopimelate/putrescine aminotransferase